MIVDQERNRLLYMQREDPRIQNSENTFKLSEFRIPALSEGSEIHFNNEDILGEPYELDFYSPMYQGAAIDHGAILQTHGWSANRFGSSVGIMYFDTLTHSFVRHLDLTDEISLEPQGVSVYQDRLIINFANGSFYELNQRPDAFLRGTVRDGSGDFVVIRDVETPLYDDGSFFIKDIKDTFDVIIKVPGALSCTVKNVSIANGSVNARDINVLRKNFGKSTVKDCTVEYSA